MNFGMLRVSLDMKIRIVQAGGLPGKTAPEAAGAVIADTIGNILKERSAENG